MGIEAKVILHTHGEKTNSDLISVQVRSPTNLLAEINTHRKFSRSSGSARAIPTKTQIKNLRADPFIPVFTGNQRGMTGIEGWDEKIIPPGILPSLVKKVSHGLAKRLYGISPQKAWSRAMEANIAWASAFDEANYHKQVQNRFFAPFSYTSSIITATDWCNFRALRDHEDAEPNMRKVARAIIEAIDNSEGIVREWHLPYVSDDDDRDIKDRIKSSVARCARVSYNNHDNTAPSNESDISLYGVLLANGHLSPFEHQGYTPSWFVEGSNIDTQLSGNFHGFIQFRKIAEVEIKNREGWEKSLVWDEYLRSLHEIFT